MKTTTYSKVLLGLFAICTMFTACGEEDNSNGGSGKPTDVSVDLKSVFTGGMPKSAGEVHSITYNEEGLVSTMSTSDGNVEFEYANVSVRSEDRAPSVRMKVDYGKGEYSLFTMRLGSNGFVEEAQQVEKDLDETQECHWRLKYNADGQLSHIVKESYDEEYDKEEIFVSYQNGDIVKVRQTTEEGDDDWEDSMLYTSPTINAPIENKGCVMLFDDAFDIDLDEMEYAYYAGLLGKATRHLPVGVIDDKEKWYYQWTLDEKGYPASVILDSYDNWGYRFSW